MLSDKPLPEMSPAQAIETFVRLYKTYVAPRVSGPELHAEIQQMKDRTEIEHLILDIGTAMQQAELGCNYALVNTMNRAAVLQAGLDELDNNYFSCTEIDNVISRTFNRQDDADDSVSKARIGKAMMDADIRAYRQACDIPAYREISRPILDVLFSPTGAQLPYIKELPP